MGTGGQGLNNVGLLVRMCGRVIPGGVGFFYINDGSGSDIKCILPNGATLDPAWEYVTVTGISSLEAVATLVNPVLRAPDLTCVTHVQ